MIRKKGTRSWVMVYLKYVFSSRKNRRQWGKQEGTFAPADWKVLLFPVSSSWSSSFSFPSSNFSALSFPFPFPQSFLLLLFFSSSFPFCFFVFLFLQMIGWATASLTPGATPVIFLGYHKQQETQSPCSYEHPVSKSFLTTVEWVGFKLTFLEKDICHDDEIDILRSLAKLQLRYV